MHPVIDLIQTSDSEGTKAAWDTVCEAFALQPGFMSGHLLETTETLHPREDFKFTSVCQWKTEQDWQRARQAVKADAGLSALLQASPSVFTRFDSALVQGTVWGACLSDRDTMVLVDVVYLPPERRAGYVAMWQKARAFMLPKAGYISASLYQSNAGDSDIGFINIAEWTTREKFFAALSTPEFLEILGDFKEDFALYLSKKTLVMEPKKETEGAV